MRLELERNILNFGYGVNYEYEGMLAHLFDRFYVVTKFRLPSIRDIKFSRLNFDHTCAYMNKEYAPNMDLRKYLTELRTYCNKIKPFVSYYSKLINSTFIELAYEGISSFLQQKCEKALQKAVNAMSNQASIQHNKLMKLDDTMLMYGIYNVEMLEKLINTVHEIHNVTSSHEKLFAGKHNPTLFRMLYMDALGIQQYATNSLLFLRIIQDKYISLYREVISHMSQLSECLQKDIYLTLH